MDPGIDIPIARLAGGLSGASVWRIEVGGRAMVVKLTSSASEMSVLERAEREGCFYRELAVRVPLRVPEVIGQASSPGEGTALLLPAYSPAPPLVDWTLADYERVARDLGTLHGTFWDRAPAGDAGWLGAPLEVSDDLAAKASRLWARLGVDDGLLPMRAMAERAALQVPLLDRERERLPSTLCHGDAHRDDLLRGHDGGWVWTDWQEVRWGEGVVDLTFFWQRAFTVVETVPPIEGLLGAYREGLVHAGVSGVTGDDLARSVAWAELALWLIAWPPFLGWLEMDGRGRVLRRIATLLQRLEIDVR